MTGAEPARRSGFVSAWAVLFGYVMLIVARLVDSRVTNPHLSTFLAVIFEIAIFVIPGTVCVCLMLRLPQQLARPTPSALLISRPDVRRILPCASALVGLCCLAFLLTILLCSDSTPAGRFDLYNTFTARGGEGVFGNVRLIVCYALLPAVCEEFMFRGLVCFEYRGGGVVRSVVMSSLLFGILHLELKLLPVYIVSGVVLCLVLYATRSLIACVAVHLLYNIFAIYLQPYLSSFYLTTASRALFLMLLVAIMLIAALVFCMSAARLYGHYRANAASDSGNCADSAGQSGRHDHPKQSAGTDCTGHSGSPDYPVGLTPEELLRSLRDGALSLPFILSVAIFFIGTIIF